jgi:hypothetical protein
MFSTGDDRMLNVAIFIIIIISIIGLVTIAYMHKDSELPSS